MLSWFLRGQSEVKACDIAELMYSCRYSRPKMVRNTAARRASSVLRADPKPMAWWGLREWAISKAEELINAEAKAVSSKHGGFHLPDKSATWDFMHGFSMESVLQTLEAKGPTLLRLLAAAAIRPKARILSTPPPDGASYAVYLTKPIATGTGHNRRNPFIIVLVTYMLLMSARNIRFAAFQKLMGVWLFAHTAQHGVYAILGRMGLSISYTGVLKLLRSLSVSARNLMRETAKARAFLLIYDNINRMFRARDPDRGQQDIINNGTAETFVELDDCDVEQAFDVQALRSAQDSRAREGLTMDVLERRIDWNHMNKIFALHCLRVLVQAVDGLEQYHELVLTRFRTTMAVHRMRKGRVTRLHPMATTDFNEGNTAENGRVLDDMMLSQLGLPKEEVDKLLVIVGGDQSTVEKLRTLKKFLASCPHGYARYGWVLPLIQLWHMGWADLERVLSTHWGKSQASDVSTFKSTNIVMGRKVQNVKRPDYYPAQHLVFDNLKVEILECWRQQLGASDLAQHFSSNNVAFEDLLPIADQLVQRFFSNDAYELALMAPDVAAEFLPVGEAWTSAPPSAAKKNAKEFRGDQVFANGVLRRRDSMLQMEFQYGLADGDMGRAFHVMKIWTFTFAGSGKSKYANELLELACNFEFEYSLALQLAIMNNWLCNLSGLEGCWFPMDLLQEKNIKQLKKMSTRRDASFGGAFFQDVVSLNIRAFLGAIRSVRTSFKLGAKGGSHQRKKKEAAEKELARSIVEHGLLTFRAGRTTGHVARDDFMSGHKNLSNNNEKKLKDFVQRTIRDAGALHESGEVSDDDTADEASAGTSAAAAAELPMPAVIVDGTLVSAEELFERWEDSDTEDEGFSEVLRQHADPVTESDDPESESDAVASGESSDSDVEMG
ncbi:hypothetical protein FA95DRAFT_1550988 [Auriscalpium vulgare]|uniref:Uncharacterized protein n=1 Tax=Auriscalpium vulgare TaxID=40419 RepID=A0ACB8R486_9AGAM|nr:hypothetical protein FA95DRAFT_1550988 [Auriscalpium vulgare]